MKIRVLLLLFPLLLSCSIFENEQIVELSIIGEWVHSFEEDNLAYIYTYRPKESIDFSPFRFRSEIHLYKSGIGKALVQSDNDAHYFDSISWKLDQNTHGEFELRISNQEFGEVTYIVEISNSEILLLRDTVLRNYSDDD